MKQKELLDSSLEKKEFASGKKTAYIHNNIGLLYIMHRWSIDTVCKRRRLFFLFPPFVYTPSS